MKFLRNRKVIKLVSTIVALVVVVSLAAGTFSSLQSAGNTSATVTDSTSLRESLQTVISSGRAALTTNPRTAAAHPAAAASLDTVLTRCAIVAADSTATLAVLNLCGTDVVTATTGYQALSPAPTSTATQ